MCYCSLINTRLDKAWWTPVVFGAHLSGVLAWELSLQTIVLLVQLVTQWWAETNKFGMFINWKYANMQICKYFTPN